MGESEDKIAREDGKFSEADWNETSTREAGAYLLSKTLAETWLFRVRGQGLGFRVSGLGLLGPGVGPYSLSFRV